MQKTVSWCFNKCSWDQFFSKRNQKIPCSDHSTSTKISKMALATKDPLILGRVVLCDHPLVGSNSILCAFWALYPTASPRENTLWPRKGCYFVTRTTAVTHLTKLKLVWWLPLRVKTGIWQLSTIIFGVLYVLQYTAYDTIILHHRIAISTYI